MIEIKCTQCGGGMTIGSVVDLTPSGGGTVLIDPCAPGRVKALEAEIERLQLRLAEANRNCDQAIAQANARDQKWQTGIEELVGHKLNWGLGQGDPEKAVRKAVLMFATPDFHLADKYAKERDEWRENYFRVLRTAKGILEQNLLVVQEEFNNHQP